MGIIVFKIEQYWERPVIIIEDLAVKEEDKRENIGKLLMAALEKCAKKNKINRILFKPHRKSPSIGFYKK